mgnify:FL=1
MKRSVQKFFLWCVIVGALSWTVYLLSVPARSSRAYEIREDWIVEYHDSVFTEMQVDRRIVDLGDVPPDSMIYADYVIRNTGENPLSIHKVDPDCSCTDFTIDRTEAEPGGRIHLRLQVDTHHKIGENVLNTVIWANTPASLHILKLKFNVLSDYSDGADEVLLFDDGTVDLGELPLGGSREVRVGAKNGSDKPVVVVEAYSSCDCTQVTYDRKPVQPGEKVFFTVRFSAEQPGTFFKKIAVRHSASDKPVTFAVQGIVTDE